MRKHLVRLNIEALDEAVRAVAYKEGRNPTRSLLIERLDISRATLYAWINKGISLDGLFKLEALSGVPRERLSPELFRRDEAA